MPSELRALMPTCSTCGMIGGHWVAYDPSTRSMRCANCVGLPADEAQRRNLAILNALARLGEKRRHAHFAAAFEQRTGKCPECYGSGQVVDHVHAIRSRGQHEQWVCRKPCPRCRRKVECHA